MEQAATDPTLASAMSPQEKAEFAQLAREYHARADAWAAAAKLVAAPAPRVPLTTPPESDAATILVVKGKVQDIRKRASAATDTAIKTVNDNVSAYSSTPQAASDTGTTAV